MYDMTNRAAPVRDELLRLLREAEDAGLTTAEIAARMGKDVRSTSASLCRMQLYGYVVKIPHKANGRRRPQEFNTWKLKR
jgi:predicted transcriptional regulator